MNSFGERLRDLRKNKGMSQDRLAELLAVRSGKQTISNWENGRSEPSLSDIRRIVEILDSSASYLVEGIEGQKPAPAVPPGQILMDAGEVIKMQRELMELRSRKSTENQ